MKNSDNSNNAGEKFLMNYTNLFGNLIVDESPYLELISNKVTF